MALASISKQCNSFFASLTLANQLNINFGIALKQEGRGGGPPTLCKNFAGLGRTRRNFVHYNQPLRLSHCDAC